MKKYFKKSLLTAAASLLCAVLALGGCSSRQVKVANVNSAAVPSGMAIGEVKRSIIEGCDARGWICKDIDEDTIEGSIWVRGKHYAQVSIDYSVDNYSIQYSDSKELKYNAKNNSIHKNYNSWIMNLNGDIMNALMRNSR